MRVVLADNDVRMREVVRLALAGRAVVVAEVATARACLAAIAEYQPDAVLLAADLPDDGGQEPLALLRRRSGPSPRVLLLGGDKPSGRSAPGSHAVAYLPYPFDAQDLLSEIDRLMAGLRSGVGR